MTPPAVEMASIRRVLIVKLSALGDVIHALPVSAALGETFPNLELSWAVEEPFVPLVQGNPYLKEIVALPKLRVGRLRDGAFRRDYFGRLRAIRARRFDLTLDLQGLTKSAVVALASGAKFRLGYPRLREAARLVSRPVPKRPESAHIVEQYLDVARHLGADPNPVRFPFVIPAEDETAVTAMLCEGGLEPGKPFVAVNPATAQVIKNWGVERYAALMDGLRAGLGLEVVLVTADKTVAEQVRSVTRQPFLDLAGRTNLKQLAAVLRRCAVHVCGDTGSGHLAAALGRPVVSLVGPTDPERIYPYGQRDNVLSRREVCGPKCDWHHCQYGRPRCLDAIAADEVLAKIVALSLRERGE